jgi:hypothetical protein
VIEMGDRNVEATVEGLWAPWVAATLGGTASQQSDAVRAAAGAALAGGSQDEAMRAARKAWQGEAEWAGATVGDALHTDDAGVSAASTAVRVKQEARAPETASATAQEGGARLISVFISYRRQDVTAGWAALIHERLSTSIGADLFVDVDNLPYGVDFEQHIRDVLQRCDVTLVLIGQLWLNAVDESGSRRLDDPTDIHRMEVAEALRRTHVRVIPVLFGSVKMPAVEQLPEGEPDIRPLVKRHAFCWHLDQAAPAQLQDIASAVRLGRVTRGGEQTAPLGTGSGEPREVDDLPRAQVGESADQFGRALSAQVVALCAELLAELSDEALRTEVERIQRTLLEPDDEGRPLLGDAVRADEALVRLDALSYRGAGLCFIRDRVEQLRETGPDMPMIGLAKWYARCSGSEIEIPDDKREELKRLLAARSAAERLGLDRDASDQEVRAAARERARVWRTFEVAGRASPMAQRLASDVVGFYDGIVQSKEQLGRSIVSA